MYNLSEQDLEIQTRARAFADELIPLEVDVELANGELDADLEAAHTKRAIELGIYASNLPKSCGGGGCTSVQQVLIQEQVGRVTNALAWVVATPPSWLPEVATQDQIERYVRPSARGERSECYAITEEGAGSDVDAIEATARRDGDDYVLNGVKWHVTSYYCADYAFFQGKLVGGEHDGEHAMFLVDLPSPGVRVVRTPAYMHTLGHAHQHPIVAFEDVRVPAAQLVGAEGDGMSFAYEWFRFERLMVAARCLGAAERLVAEMTDFAKQRVVSGQPIAEFGAVQAMLADSLTELFAARSLTYETARGIDSGVDVKIQHAQCSMAKLYAAEMAGRVADRAVQVFGGRGYMREYAAERFYRELRVERIWEGTSEVQRSIIADQMVKRGPSRLA
ncbi:MAG TPA: acyl-CoA dehydrogenase family protein [Streptosporangiaceae bacterium]|nr:acyl-CoA dehydrogenase family protein [Streptosporangiaceae bacterium]